MNIQTLQNKITEFIQNEFLYDKPNIQLTPDLNVIEQGILDSMDIFRLIQFIESEANIVLEPEEMVQSNFQTINDMLQFILKKQDK